MSARQTARLTTLVLITDEIFCGRPLSWLGAFGWKTVHGLFSDPPRHFAELAGGFHHVAVRNGDRVVCVQKPKTRASETK